MGRINGLGRVMCCALLAWAVWIPAAGPCWADDVTDSIDEALQQYKAGRYNEAAGTLDYAAELIRQKRGETLRSLLPEPLRGWTAEEPTSQAFGTAMFGGMVSAERRYEKGEASITVKIVVDSPLLQSLIMTFANPLMAAASGSEVSRIKGQKALVHYAQDERKGEINVVVLNRYLVSVQGEGISRDDLMGYASAISYERIEKF